MAQLDPEKWAKNLAANPPPLWGSDPEQWPAEIDYTGNDFGRAYGFSVLLFAERWADEMERRLAERPELSVADVAEAADHTANQSLGRFGMTGFQYGCAVSRLSHCWVRGDELRRWHNLRTQRQRGLLLRRWVQAVAAHQLHHTPIPPAPEGTGFLGAVL